jgi:hypothetical protein
MSELTKEQIEGFGYSFPRLLPTGEWAALCKYFYTVGLLVGLDETGWRTRFCYENFGDALIALAQWDGKGDPCGPWIKNKGTPYGDRHNPRCFFGIPVVMEPMEKRA